MEYNEDKFEEKTYNKLTRYYNQYSSLHLCQYDFHIVLLLLLKSANMSASWYIDTISSLSWTGNVKWNVTWLTLHRSSTYAFGVYFLINSILKYNNKPFPYHFLHYTFIVLHCEHNCFFKAAKMIARNGMYKSDWCLVHTSFSHSGEEWFIYLSKA